MKIIELILDEENEDNGITAISVVENPAIEEDFIALKNQEVKFAEQDKEKRILMGAALIPNKPIYRKNEEDEYYIFFSASTVRKASELFFIKGNQSEATLEHKVALEGLTIVESWIVESEQDKSRHYGMNVPVGTWMVSMKVNSDEVWNDYIRTKKVRGFSIEAYFSSKLEQRPKDKTLKEEAEANELLNELKEFLTENKTEENLKEPCYPGYEMIGFKMKNGKKVPNCVPMNSQKLQTMIINEDYAVIDDRLAYSTQEKAEEMAANLNCSGFHTHDLEEKTWFMPCESHNNNKDA